MMTDHKRTYSQRGDDYLLEAQKLCEKEKPAPRCPYCGGEMKKRGLSDYKMLCFWLCSKCSATSPCTDTAEDAYTAAMQRWQEPNRVLTLGEVQNLAYVRYEQQHILVVEYRAIIKGTENVFRPCVIAHDRMRMVEIWEIYDGARMLLMEKSMYGKNWRCWLRKPTQEEMEDTPWMNQ